MVAERGIHRVLIVACAAVLLARCGAPGSASAPASSAANASHDKLAQIEQRGRLILSTDPAYPPASFAVEGAVRSSPTRCATDELTGAEVDGYDVATSKLVAADLGVEPCFIAPGWSELIAGNWADRWDIAFSSIGITRGRMEVLYFTRPYYATPESFFVRSDAPTRTLEDLNGLEIGVCTGCFADLYLQHQLDIPGAQVDYRVDDAVIVGYEVEHAGLADVAAGRLDAFLCQDTAGQQAIDEGLDLRKIEPAAYVAYPAGAIDRSSGLAAKAFFDRVNEILAARHADGTLAGLSRQFFGADFAAAAGTFDIKAVAQTVS